MDGQCLSAVNFDKKLRYKPVKTALDGHDDFWIRLVE